MTSSDLGQIFNKSAPRSVTDPIFRDQIKGIVVFGSHRTGGSGAASASTDIDCLVKFPASFLVKYMQRLPALYTPVSHYIQRTYFSDDPRPVNVSFAYWNETDVIWVKKGDVTEAAGMVNATWNHHPQPFIGDVSFPNVAYERDIFRKILSCFRSSLGGIRDLVIGDMIPYLCCVVDSVGRHAPATMMGVELRQGLMHLFHFQGPQDPKNPTKRKKLKDFPNWFRTTREAFAEGNTVRETCDIICQYLNHFANTLEDAETTLRRIMKFLMKFRWFGVQRDLMQFINFRRADYSRGEPMADGLKKVAFQFCQTLGLLTNCPDIFTKQKAAEFRPNVAWALYREHPTPNGLVALNKLVDDVVCLSYNIIQDPLTKELDHREIINSKMLASLKKFV
jgi:hypothetical protein